MRSSDFVSFSRMATLWYQVICASTACTIGSSGHASAKARMYFRLRGENPFMSGKDRFRSVARRSITFAPYFSRSCRSRITHDQFPVDDERCAQLRRLNPAFQLCEKLTATVGSERFHGGLMPIVVHFRASDMRLTFT